MSQEAAAPAILKDRRAWVRLVFLGRGLETAEGDCTLLLGTEASTLLESREPLALLPPPLSDLIASAVRSGPVSAFCGDLLAVLMPTQRNLEVLLFRRNELEGASGWVVDDLGAGVVGADQAGTISIWNRSMADIFHLPADAAVGRSLESVLPQPVLFTWPSILSASAEGRQVKVDIRPGQDRRIEAVFVPGGPGVLGTFTDTSDSFETEQRLRTARRMNQTYLQTVRTGIVMFGPDYRLIVANKFFGELFGAREELGIPIYEILPTECFSDLEEVSGKLFEKDASHPKPSRISCTSRDGRRLIVQQTFRPVGSDDDESYLAVGVFEDLSDQVRAEESLRETTRRNSLLSALLAQVSTAGLPAGSAALAEGLCEALGAQSTAVYFSEPYSTTRLTGTWGQWGTTLPPDFADLRFPPSVWSVLPGSSLSEHELGVLRGVTEHCAVIPVGAGSANRGFLLASFGDQAAADSSLIPGGMVADMLRLRAEFVSQSSQLEQTTYFLEKQRRFLRELVASADIPVAVFGEDWRVVHWNPAMEEVTGCVGDAARKRTASVMDMLFGSVGGVAAARKLIRRFGAAEAPAVWEIRKPDGSTASLAWKLFRADAAETDSVEALTVLMGAPLSAGSPDVEGIEASAGRLDEMTRSVVRLVSAESVPRLAEAIASAALAASGAGGAEVRLETGQGPVIARAGCEEGPETGEEWSIPVQAGSAPSGLITLHGGAPTPVLRDFAGASARVLEKLGEQRTGTLVESVLRNPGGYAVFDTSRKALSSTLRTAGGELLPSGGDLAAIAGDSRPSLETAFTLALKIGRSVVSPPEWAGRGESLVFDSIGNPGSNPLVMIYPVSAGRPSDSEFMGGESILGIASSLLGQLPGFVGSSREKAAALGRTVHREDPLRPALNSLTHELSSLGRTVGMLRLLLRAAIPAVVSSDPAEVLDGLVTGSVKAERRPPDLRIEGDLPRLAIDGEFLTDLLQLVAGIGGSGDVPEVDICGLTGSAVPEFGMSVAGGAVAFLFRWRSRLPAPGSVREAVDELGRGVVEPSSMVALTCLLLKVAGCDCRPAEDGRALRIVVPAARE